MIPLSRPKLSDTLSHTKLLKNHNTLPSNTCDGMDTYIQPIYGSICHPTPLGIIASSAKQLAEMWQTFFSSTVDVQVSIPINAVIISFLPGSSRSTTCTSPRSPVIFFPFLKIGFFTLFLMLSHKVLLFLPDIFHHHIT